MLSRRDFGRATLGFACLPALSWSALAEDARLGKPKTVNDFFPFTPPKTLAEWEARRQVLREQVTVANGLWPMPEKTPLGAVIHGKIAREGYTIEKVYFASTPGHYVTGNLYRPTEFPEAKKPAVLFAHGHWAGGRLHEESEAVAKQAIGRGEESDVNRGRYFMQALPATLAKLGFVVFHYDMIGYAESTAIPHILKSAVAHPDGFADVAGELRLQSLTGLQTWNSIRSVDFLSELPDVDAKRLAITGASGGGTQTFLLTAIDDRIAAAFPAVMVSTGMQGGCVCENASYLRVNTGNIELAGLFAPKPLAMSGANDWTKEIMTLGLPELRKLYKLYNAEEKVAAKAWVQFPHNYGQPSREFMYTWFRKHLMGKPDAVQEGPFEPVPVAQLKVFDAEHPRPKSELAVMPLRKKLAEASDAQMAKLAPAERSKITLSALRAMLNTTLPKPGEVAVADYEKSDGKGYEIHSAKLSRRGSGEALASQGLIPTGFAGEHAVLWLHPKGVKSLQDNADVKVLLNAKIAVLAIDIFARNPAQTVNKNYAGFTFGYNRSTLAERVHDVLTALGNLLDNAKVKKVSLVGFQELGPVAMLAKCLAGDKVSKLCCDLNNFRYENITSMDDPMMQPGAIKYGGLPGFFATITSGEILLHNHPALETFKTTGATVLKQPKLESPAEAVKWLASS
jgi:dienelactone hydrolase